MTKTTFNIYEDDLQERAFILWKLCNIARRNPLLSVEAYEDLLGLADLLSLGVPRMRSMYEELEDELIEILEREGLFDDYFTV